MIVSIVTLIILFNVVCVFVVVVLFSRKFLH